MYCAFCLPWSSATRTLNGRIAFSNCLPSRLLMAACACSPLENLKKTIVYAKQVINTPNKSNTTRHPCYFIFQHRPLNDLTKLSKNPVNILLCHIFRQIRYIQIWVFHVLSRRPWIWHFQTFISAKIWTSTTPRLFCLTSTNLKL